MLQHKEPEILSTREKRDYVFHGLHAHRKKKLMKLQKLYRKNYMF